MGLKEWLFGPRCKNCNEERTKNDSGICDDCELKAEAAKERQHQCPLGHQTMKKEIVDGIIIDRCPKCKGVWLDKEELEKMQDIAEDEASSSRVTGLVVGMAAGSMMGRMGR